MPSRKLVISNPVAFTPWPVTFFTALIYAAVTIPLLIVHHIVPSAPQSPTPVNGINTSEAWADLQELTNGFHPYNSRRNDEVRVWLLQRIEWTLQENGASYSIEPDLTSDENIKTGQGQDHPHSRNGAVQGYQAASPVTIFNDLISNVTFSGIGSFDISGHKRRPGQSVYFEGTNIVVYIRGSEDDQRDWWDGVEEGRPINPTGSGGVLVNAHYDSVSTGFGATDDGVGVVTTLQLIKYYTTPGNEPKKGLVVLFNNGEEDFLNGARAFAQHPISRFPHTFLNLEGAGAGGRATLFRTTDTEVTRAYGNSPFPFGSVVSADGFKQGLIRSQTDYVIFNGILGMRGLDVAFMEPRARYHTDRDDARHSSINSLWHMLSAALATTKSLTSDTSSTFEGDDEGTNNGPGKVPSGQGSVGVWFDVFGRGFAVLQLRTLFAISLTLLVASPLLTVVVLVVLSRHDKLYYFSSKARPGGHSDGEPVYLQGWRGFSRFPLTVIVASAVVIALAFLVNKVNPFIVHSSPYAVWSMMLCAFLVVSWLLIGVATFVRPSALYRGYALFWLYVLTWILLLIDTVLEDRLKLAGGYSIFFYCAAAFLAHLTSLLECFVLPQKSEYATAVEQDNTQNPIPGVRRQSTYGTAIMEPSADEGAAIEGRDENEEEATEQTSLLRGRHQITFANYPDAGDNRADDGVGSVKGRAYGSEQDWSFYLPRWTWLLQLLFLAPINLIIIGQLGLFVTSALSQTGADGSSTLTIYIFIAVFAILLLLPLGPFLHRMTHHLPMLFLFILIATVVHNLVAFPFSSNNRYKVYFLQTIDLDDRGSSNRVWLTGIESYVQEIISNIPSAASQRIECEPDTRGKSGLSKCSWIGLAPAVVPNQQESTVSEAEYADWLRFNVTQAHNGTARFHLWGRNTRACKIAFNKPISNFSVDGAGPSPLFDVVPPETGSQEIRLWRRQWEQPWDIWVKWNSSDGKDISGEGIGGKVLALWSDANSAGTIPALEELRRYAPPWVAFTKLADGLVEGSKQFEISPA